MRAHCSSRRRYAVAGLIVFLGLAAGCGGPDDDAVAGNTATTAAATTAADTPTEAPQDDCGPALDEIKASLTGQGDVTSVDVPTCAKAVVGTSLGAGDGEKAASLCQNAASAAGTHGVAAVSVVSADGKELATGTNSTDCKAR